MIKNIIILGGGTSGWLTAVYMLNNLVDDIRITLIEDESIGPIGVGEGTQPATAQFLYDSNFHPTEWMSKTDATFKYGVEVSGWTKDTYFVDNEPPENSLINQHLLITDYFGTRTSKEWFDYMPSYQLAKKNLSQKWYGLDVNFNISDRSYGAVHFNALKIVKVLKDRCVKHPKFKLTIAKIKDITTNESGITSLQDEQGNFYKADLYIDCTGFSSLLLEKTLKEPHIPYNNILLCDKAVAIPKEYKNPKEECHPYTKAISMGAGWRWQIPTFNRIGNGYVYSSKYLDKEHAEIDLRKAIGENKAEALHIDIKAGTHKNIAVKNVCAVGLSAGFIEPLEANNLTWTTSIIRLLTEAINRQAWETNGKEFINGHFTSMNEEILAFIFGHYHYSSRNDTEFWKKIRSQPLSILPIGCQKILNDICNNKSSFFYRNSSMFNLTQWFSMLHAGKAITGKKLPPEVEKYALYFIKNHYNRIEQASEFFKNHYEYLSEAYEKN